MSIISNCIRILTQSQEIKGYKVTNADRSRKFGIACRNLSELKQKACAKLNINDNLSNVGVFLLDGSEIDEDYFRTLQPQTTLIVQKQGEIVRSDADIFYELLKKVHNDYLTAGHEISNFLTEKLKIKVAVLNSVLSKNDSKTLLSSRKDHPEWFEGLETNVSTKEAYMHRRCQDRIRGYLYKTVEQIKSANTYKDNKEARRRLLRVITFLKLQLKEDHYFGHYFDRSRVQVVRVSGDDTDSSNYRQCYDHCPCRLDVYLPIEERFFTDEVDAKKCTKDDASDDELEDKLFYQISPSNTRQQIVLCDKKGEFKCGGIWNANICRYGDRHKINPYRSREELILFSTWNLDHRIERSRTLIPQLIQMAEQDDISDKDVNEFYDNLFTVKNLKLVHIICHDKSIHR